MRKICIVTGSRAEWGLQSRLARLIADDSESVLQIVATNMHLSPEFGLTYKEIEQNGFTLNKKVEMLLSSDTANATVKSVGLGMIGFADAFEDLQPDLIVILGDRYEMLAAAAAALLYKIPIAHLYGGEITEGAYDDAIRHTLTKLSHLHFTSTEAYRKRVIQMGEQPDLVFNVGAMGIDNIRHMQLLDREELEASISGFKINRKTLLVTYHPVTMENGTAKEQVIALLKALEKHKECRIIFTMPNSDTDGRIIIELIKDWCSVNIDRAIWFTSLGVKRYLSALQFVGAVVGNSSSGIVEVPSFGIPTLNIGDRQKGRLKAVSIIDSQPTFEDIENKLSEILENSETYRDVINPYERKDSTKEIFRIIKNVKLDNYTPKHFYDL